MKKVRFLEIKAKLGLVENTNEDEEIIREKLAETNLDGKVHSVRNPFIKLNQLG